MRKTLSSKQCCLHCGILLRTNANDILLNLDHRAEWRDICKYQWAVTAGHSSVNQNIFQLCTSSDNDKFTILINYWSPMHQLGIWDLPLKIYQKCHQPVKPVSHGHGSFSFAAASLWTLSPTNIIRQLVTQRYQVLRPIRKHTVFSQLNAGPQLNAGLV